MRKKYVLPLILSSVVLTSCGALPNDMFNTLPNVLNNQETLLNVNVETQDDRVQVEVVASAYENDVVDIALAYDEKNIEVYDLRVNTSIPAKVNDKSYYFVMPASEVSISYKVRELNPTTYIVNNTQADKGIVLTGLKSSYLVGESVTLGVSFLSTSGYTFTDKVSVYTLDEGEVQVPVETSLNGTIFTFTMPTDDVYVEVGIEERYYMLTKTSGDSNIQSVWYGENSIYNSGIVKYGDQVEVRLKDTDAISATGIEIVETGQIIDLTDIENKIVVFTMPAHSVTIKSVGVKNMKGLTLNHSTNINLAAGTYEDGVFTEADSLSFQVKSTIAIKTLLLNENWAVGSITITYGNSSIIATKVASNIYTFTMPNADDVQVSVSEVEIKFKNYAFVGDFYGANVYGTSPVTKLSDSYSLSIDGTGKVLKGTSTTKYITDAVNSDNGGIAKMGDTSNFAYGDRVIVGHYGFSKLMGEDIVNDFIIATKKQEETDTKDDYSIEGKLLSSKAYAITVFKRKGEFYTCAFVDINNKQWWLNNVTIEYDPSTTSILDSSAVYTIKVNDVAMFTVSGSTVTKVVE